MRIVTALFISGFVCLTNLTAAPKEDEATETNSDPGGVQIEPGEGQISPNSELTVTFPNSMVGTDKIDLADQPCPLTSQPKMEGNFTWKSQTEGVFVVKSVVAGAKHRVTLAPGLKDLSGKPVVAPNWSAQYDATPFTISGDSGERDKLDNQPQVRLEASYPVRLTEVVDHVYFQDRDNHQRFP